VNVAIISLSNEGARVAAQLAGAWALVSENGSVPSPDRLAADIYLHAGVLEMPQVKRFDRIADLTRDIFSRYDALVYVAPVGLVVRAIAPCLEHKTRDPAVVVLDVGARWAVSLLGGHEAGANALAMDVANVLGAEPVISTTTEAVRDLIVGVGCRRGTPAASIVAAVRGALAMTGCDLSRVRMLASADLKADEPGLIEAARELAVPLRLINSDEVRNTPRSFGHSHYVQKLVDLPAVAEPAALLAGSRTRLILPKTVANGVTVAIARENCSSLG